MYAEHDLHRIPEAEHLSFYGALFAMAAADGKMDADEISLIFATLETDDFSEEGRQQLLSFLAEPPVLVDCLAALSGANKVLRFGLYLHLLDVAIADHKQSRAEEMVIKQAQMHLGIGLNQAEAMERFVNEAQRIQERGLDDAKASTLLVTAAVAMRETGVPLLAIYFSSSVVNLRAHGIANGEAAIHHEVGGGAKVGGAILLGIGIYYGVRLLVAPGKVRRERVRAEHQRHLVAVIQHLNEARTGLITRISSLPEGMPDKSRLTSRLKVMDTAIARHETELRDL